ncbi:MAG TPA: TolC family protein, partial [Opitutaceae bacterium]
MKWIFVGAIFAVAAFGQTGAPSTRRTSEISLRGAIEQALARNFDLQVDRQEGVLSQAQLESATAAYVPSVRLGLDWTRSQDPITTTLANGESESDNIAWTGGVSALLPSGGTLDFAYSLSGDKGSQTIGSGTSTLFSTSRGTLGLISLSQPLLKGRRIDGTRLTIKQRKLDVRNAELIAQASAIDTVAAVEQAYYQLVAARETVKVREAALGLAQRTVTDTLSRREIGIVAPLEEKQAQSSAATAEADVISARQSVRERENALKTLISDSFSVLSGVELIPSDPLSSEITTVDYAASVDRALANRPELAQLDLTVDARELTIAYQRDQRLPQLDVVGGYGVTGSATSNSSVLAQWRDRNYPYYTVGVQVSFPWNNKRARNDLRSAEVQKRQAELRAQQQRDVVRSQIDTAVAAVRASFERIGATRRAREYAQTALTAEQEKLNAGG